MAIRIRTQWRAFGTFQCMSLTWVVVTVAELAEAGLDERAIRAACRSGRLTRLGRGVYLDGPRLAGVEGWQ